MRDSTGDHLASLKDPMGVPVKYDSFDNGCLFAHCASQQGDIRDDCLQAALRLSGCRKKESGSCDGVTSYRRNLLQTQKHSG